MEGRFACDSPEQFQILQLPGYLRLKLLHVIIIKGEGGVNLGKRKIGMLFMNGIGAPAISQMVKHHLDDLYILPLIHVTPCSSRTMWTMVSAVVMFRPYHHGQCGATGKGQ